MDHPQSPLPNVAPTLQRVALAAGCSAATASRALHNPQSVSALTRARVMEAASRLGYQPNLMAKEMARARWQNARSSPLSIAFLRPPLQGGPMGLIIKAAQERATELNYRWDQFASPTSRSDQHKLDRILAYRGFNGLVLPAPGDNFKLEHQWEKFCCVLIGEDAPQLSLSRVYCDWATNYRLAYHEVLARGYQRVGFVLYDFPGTTCHSEQIAQTMLLNQQQLLRGRPPLPPHIIQPMHREGSPPSERITGPAWHRETSRLSVWMRTQQPDVIITNMDFTYYFLKDLGITHPRDCGLCLIRCTEFPNCSEVSGIDTHPRERGRYCIDIMHHLIQEQQKGIIPVPMRITVAGTWREGQTLAPVRPSHASC